METLAAEETTGWVERRAGLKRTTRETLRAEEKRRAGLKRRTGLKGAGLERGWAKETLPGPRAELRRDGAEVRLG